MKKKITDHGIMIEKKKVKEAYFVVVNNKNKTVFEIKPNGAVKYRTGGKLETVKNHKDLALAMAGAIIGICGGGVNVSGGGSWEKECEDNKTAVIRGIKNILAEIENG